MLEAARDLYALAPSDFTAARNQLAKELKAEGQVDDAQIVAKLRKPRLAEWALNRLAREERDVVDRFALAVASAQAAQSAAIGGTAGDIREATAELRRATSAAADAAVRGLSADGGNGEAQRDDLTTILRELVGAADATPLLAGVIGSEALVTSGEFFPGAPDPPPVDSPTVTAPAHARKAAARRSGTAPEIVTTAAGAERAGASGGAAATAAARTAMVRAERHGLAQTVTASDRAVAAAQANVDAAAAELARRRTELRAATTAATAAASALAAFDTEHQASR